MLRLYSWKTGVYIQYPRLCFRSLEALVRRLGLGGKRSLEFAQWSVEWGGSVLKSNAGHFALVQESEYEEFERSITPQEVWAEGFFLVWAGKRSPFQCLSILIRLGRLRHNLNDHQCSAFLSHS